MENIGKEALNLANNMKGVFDILKNAEKELTNLSSSLSKDPSKDAMSQLTPEEIEQAKAQLAKVFPDLASNKFM